MLKCPLCNAELGTVSVFLTHLRVIHASDSAFNITCGLQGCPRTFNNFHTYRNHVYAMHDLADLNEPSHSTDVPENNEDPRFESSENMDTLSNEGMDDDQADLSSRDTYSKYIYGR